MIRKMINHQILFTIIFLILCFFCGCINTSTPPPESVPGPSIIEIEDIAASGTNFTITDAIGREIEIPKNITSMMCVGPGCLRYLSYLKKSGFAQTNNPEERQESKSKWLPYLIINQDLKSLPSIQSPVYPGQIQALTPKPDLIILMNASGPFTPDDISKYTSVPVIVLKEGDLVDGREDMNYSLRVIGLLTGSSERAEEVIQFFDKLTDNLKSRVSTIPEFQVKNAYIGGYSEGNPGGILSSSPNYIPFKLVNVDNSLRDSQKSDMKQSIQTITPGMIKGLNPAGIFIDLSTTDNKISAINEIEKISEFTDLKAVKDGSVYGLFPDSVYGKDHEIDIINAYMVGKTVYPDKFIDVDPKTISEYVFTFLYGEPIFDDMNKKTGNLALTRIPVFT